MKNGKIRIAGAIGVLAIWLLLTLGVWLLPDKTYSDTERAPLDQKPVFNWERLISAEYMKDFADYATDQFPLRDTFRQVKALFHSYGLMQSDNNGKYLHDGYLVEMEHAVNEKALDRAESVFNQVYENVLKDKTQNIYVSVIPDKGYYLAQDSGHLRLDVEALENHLQGNMPWAQYVDIKGCLSREDYYYTDTHWRQEKIAKVAQVLCSAMGTSAPGMEAYEVTTLDRPFYGVYYGQAALPVQPETMYILENEMLSQCEIFGFEANSSAKKDLSFYNIQQLNSPDMKDPYNVFLHGSTYAFVSITNPNANTDRELVIFRDSFGCSLAPLMVADYARVTVVDLRVFQPVGLLGFEKMGFLNLENADVLFLYSTLVLNNESSFQAG